MTSDNENDDEEHEEPQNTQITDKRRQRRFTIQEIASIIWTVLEHLMEQHGMSCREACTNLNISYGMHWALKKKRMVGLKLRRTTSERNAFIKERFLLGRAQARIIAIHI